MCALLCVSLCLGLEGQKSQGAHDNSVVQKRSSFKQLWACWQRPFIPVWVISTLWLKRFYFGRSAVYTTNRRGCRSQGSLCDSEHLCLKLVELRGGSGGTWGRKCDSPERPVCLFICKVDDGIYLSTSSEAECLAIPGESNVSTRDATSPVMLCPQGQRATVSVVYSVGQDCCRLS